MKLGCSILVTLTLVISLILAAPVLAQSAKLPVQVSTNGRYLVDQNGTPFLLHGDTAWSIIAQLTREDAEIYLENRRRKGFNAIVVNLLEYYYATNPPRNVYGVAPFATPGDFSMPVEEYFVHADWVLSRAAEKGIIVLLNPCYIGYSQDGIAHARDGFSREVEANGQTKCRNFGRYLGRRYKDYPNIIWVAGGDQTLVHGSAREQNWLEILLGIKDHAPHHPWTAHWVRPTLATNVEAFNQYINLNGVYASQKHNWYFHEWMLKAHNLPIAKPTFLWEGWYEGFDGVKSPPRQTVRRQAYEANLSGSTGQNFGSHHIWSFGAITTDRKNEARNEPDLDWKKWMDQGGSLDMVRVKQLFASREWWNLVPDQKHTVVIGGYGTLGKADYVTTAFADDNRLVLAYVPSTEAETRTLTVDLSRLSGNVSAQWYDPTNGTYCTVAGSPFANTGSRDFTTPGANFGADRDWVLVLETNQSLHGDKPKPKTNVRLAVQRGLALVTRAASNWQGNKTCFSCHHQTLPMLAMNEAARAGFPLDFAWRKSQAEFTLEYFEQRIDQMDAGKHLPGGAGTAAYGLWALSLDQHLPDKTTTSIVSYLLQIQGVQWFDPNKPSKPSDGRWIASCQRAPLQGSQIGDTVLVLSGLEKYATAAQRPRVKAARDSAEEYLARAELRNQQDRLWRLWGLHQLGGDANAKAATRAAILAAQRPDGGWSQTDTDAASDAYSTGQTLFMLCQTGTMPDDPAVRRARDYLVESQLDDGSWLVKSRVKVKAQPYFENGDPHGEHQFLSTAATCWATAALVQVLPPKPQPARP